jgi:hypothetical protein
MSSFPHYVQDLSINTSICSENVKNMAKFCLLGSKNKIEIFLELKQVIIVLNGQKQKFSNFIGTKNVFNPIITYGICICCNLYL